MEEKVLLSLVVDANVVVGLCARERDKYQLALTELERYTEAGYRLFGPGVLVAEVLYVLCKKMAKGDITAEQHGEAIEDLQAYMGIIESPPGGDGSLVKRAEEIRAKYGCSRSADGIYLALAEALTRIGLAELLTFDDGIKNQAGNNAPTVTVRVLMPAL